LYIYVDKLLAFSPYLLLFIKFCIYGLYIFVVINCTFRPLAIPNAALCYLEFCPLPFRTPQPMSFRMSPLSFRTPPCVILNVAPVILNAVKNLFQILRSAQDDGWIYCFADDGRIFRFLST